jgi:hypothetical protein
MYTGVTDELVMGAPALGAGAADGAGGGAGAVGDVGGFAGIQTF